MAEAGARKAVGSTRSRGGNEVERGGHSFFGRMPRKRSTYLQQSAISPKIISCHPLRSTLVPSTARRKYTDY